MLENRWKKITQDEFNRILDLHDLWVKTSRQDGAQANFQNYDLRNIKFSRINLAGANLAGSNLERANLFDAYFVEANLAGANLAGANLFGANLAGANLAGANLAGANLAGANLERADLEAANLERVDFEGADLAGANLFVANLFGANLSEAHLFGANLFGVDFEGVNLDGTNLQGANFSGAINVSPKYLGSVNVEGQVVNLQAQIEELQSKLVKAQSEGVKVEEVEELRKQLADLKKKQKDAEKLQNELDEAKQKLEKKLDDNIAKAIEQLEGALKNTDNQIIWNKWTGFACWLGAIGLLVLDVFILVFMPYKLIFEDSLLARIIEIKNIFGSFSLLIFSFPVLIILLIAINLFRHQKQLMAELRHYSMLKHKIELYGGILKAAQYTAASVIELKNSNNQQSAEYIQTVFDEIKTELLKSPNFDLNNQPYIFAEEGNQIMEMFKSSTDLVKAATEISKSSLNSVSKNQRS